jgi:hypothetical protein
VANAHYVEGDKVIRTQTHRIYEAIISHNNISTPPETDPVNWLDIGPTNRWAPFDLKVGTQAIGPNNTHWKVQPTGLVTSIAIINMENANSVTLTVKDGATTVYTHTVDTSDNTSIADWYDYFFADFEEMHDYIFRDIPPYASAEHTVQFTTAAGDIKVGSIVVGQTIEIAPTQYGVKGGIVDYSRKEADEFGHMTVVKRRFSKTIDLTCLIENARLDYLVKKLSELRATPVVWYDETDFESLIAYGFYKDWTFNISYPNHSDISLQIESLT